MMAQEAKLDGGSVSPSKRWADHLDDDEDDEGADLEGLWSSPACVAAGGARDTSEAWQLLWCSEKCFKRESKPLLEQFVGISASLGGSLVPLRKARRFSMWASEVTPAATAVLLADWREAKPCVQMLMQPGDVRAPSLVIVLYEQRKAFPRAVAWAESLPGEGFQTPVQVVQTPEEVEAALKAHLSRALPGAVPPVELVASTPEAQLAIPEAPKEQNATPHAADIAAISQPPSAMSSQAAPAAALLSTPPVNSSVVAPPMCPAPMSTAWAPTAVPAPRGPQPQNPFAPPLPMSQNSSVPGGPQQNPFAPPMPMPQNPFAPPMPMQQNPILSPMAPKDVDQKLFMPVPDMQNSSAIGMAQPQNPFAPPMPMPQNPFAPPMPMPQNPFAPPMPMQQSPAIPPMASKDVNEKPFAPHMPMPQNPFAPPMPMQQNPILQPMAPKDVDEKPCAPCVAPVPQPDMNVLARNHFAPQAAFDAMMRFCPTGNINDLSAILAAAEPETYED